MSLIVRPGGDEDAPVPVRPAFHAATARKALVPPETLRKLLSDRGDLTDEKFRDERQLYCGAMKYVPYAISKLIENIPKPWEQAKFVEVAYHVNGALTIVSSTPKVVPPVYHALWGSMWTAMRLEKRRRAGAFCRLEELSYGDAAAHQFEAHLMQADAPAAVRLLLDDDGDAQIKDWLYEPQPDLAEHGVGRCSFRKGTWRLRPAALGALRRLGEPLEARSARQEAGGFLWNGPSFFTAKALNVAIPGAPTFEAPRKAEGDDSEDEDWTDFTDIGKVIVRQPIGVEVQLAYPFMYGRNVDHAAIAPQAAGAAKSLRQPSTYAANEQLFREHPATFPIPAAQLPTDDDEEELPELCLPDDFEPFCAALPLEPVNLSEAKDSLALIDAPAPYHELSGRLARPMDCALVEGWAEDRIPPAGGGESAAKAHKRLLKGIIARSAKPPKHTAVSTRRGGFSGSEVEGARQVDFLANTKFFQRTEIEWLEAAMQLCHQGYIIISMFLRMRNLDFLRLGRDFKLQPTHTLTTKERKRSRLGMSVRLLLELLKLVKLITDIHVKFRNNEINAFQLADALHHLLVNVSQQTGMHQAKYRIIRQVNRCRDLEHLILHRFDVGMEAGPGAGFWAPAWRVWVALLRGLAPLLQDFLNNLQRRIAGGRRHKEHASKLTKQRIESNFDLNHKANLRQDVANLLQLDNPVLVAKRAQTAEQHYSEAFRCWKANIPWVVPGMHPQIEALINEYVAKAADRYIKAAHYQRSRIERGEVVDRGVFQKNLGRLTRLKMRAEQDRQEDYDHDAPPILHAAVPVMRMMQRWLDGRRFRKIRFPEMGHANEQELFQKALDRLRAQHNIASRLTEEEREEASRIEKAFDAPQQALNGIRQNLSRKRIFKDVGVHFVDGYAHLQPAYSIDPEEKMTDSYLDAYLWYEASRAGLFPGWVKPADSEPLPKLVWEWANGINSSPGIWDTRDGEAVVSLQIQLNKFYDQVDWTLMRSLLGLIMDDVLVDYICARHDVVVKYKDMKYRHRIGLIRGFQFASFLSQFWGLVMDLQLLGESRAGQLAGEPGSPQGVFRFALPDQASAHPIRGYARVLDSVYLVLRYSSEESEDLVSRFLEAEPGPENQTIVGFKNKKCWPRDCRMRLYRRDVNIARAGFWDMRRRLPAAFAEMSWESGSYASVFSEMNPNLLFDMAGFEIRLQPLARMDEYQADGEYVWKLRDRASHEETCRAYVQVSATGASEITNKLRRCQLTIGNAPFERIAQKWNATLQDIVPYYREALLSTDGMQELLARYERKLQNRVKMALGSKMKVRYPPVIFYATPEIGGLGMLSVAGSLIPKQDLAAASRTEGGAQYFMSGMTHGDDDTQVPNLLKHYRSWYREFVASDRAHKEYLARLREARRNQRRLDRDEVEDLLELGIPRIRTFYARDRATLECDRGWRVRQFFRRFQFGRPVPRAWYNEGHDGRLTISLDGYRTTMLQALGGVESILEHTLFGGTGIASWEGIFFDKRNGFEDQRKNHTITKAQRGGLVKIPNRRFALWWSPTINRTSVHTGFKAQIELTGIMMTGKLDLVKEALIGIFSGHKWEKTHAGVVDDLMQVLSPADRRSDLGIADVTVPQNLDNKKSFDMEHGAPDIKITAETRWQVAAASAHDYANDFFDATTMTASYWIDVQLRWGDYDEHNIAAYAKDKYVAYTNADKVRYDCTTGIILAIDLAYNCWAAYGYWIPNLKPLMVTAMANIMRNNPALVTIRDRLKSTLQLTTNDPTEHPLSRGNFSELFGDQRVWLVDDSQVYSTSAQATTSGNRKFRAENGCLIVVNPRSGELLLSIVHKSVFQGQKRRTRLAREKAAEAILTWLRSLPSEEHPHRIVVIRKSFRSTLHQHLTDFPNIALGCTELSLPVQKILLHERVGEMVSAATESRALRRSLYDDWADKLDPGVCFRRLLLLLRGFHVDLAHARGVLAPDRSVVTAPDHYWPTLTTARWVEVEEQLHDVVLADYARRNGINVSQLTAAEVESIMLGQEMRTVDIQKEETAAVEQQTKTTLETARAVTRRNRLGQEMEGQVSRIYQAGSAAGMTTWRDSALQAAALQSRIDRLFVADAPAETGARRLILPRKLLARLGRCADAQHSVLALLFGVPTPQEPGIREVRAAVLPPQVGKADTVTASTGLELPVRLGEDESDAPLKFLGILRMSPTAPDEPLPVLNSDLLMLGQQSGVMSNGDLVPDESPLAVVLVGIANDHAVVSGHVLTEEGTAFAQRHPPGRADDPLAEANCVAVPPANTAAAMITVADTFDGSVFVPEGSWNFPPSRRPPDNLRERKYTAAPGVPLAYHAAPHRLRHFQAFAHAERMAPMADVWGADEGAL